MTLFILYVLFFIGLAFFELDRAKSAEGFFLNNRSSGTAEVASSLLASTVGGSATIGLAGLAFTAGFPAIWWLLSGAIGLGFLTFFLVDKLRDSKSLTMPELIKDHLGISAYKAISGVILIAWGAILAAQFIAMGTIISSLTGLSVFVSVLMGVVFITIYTLIGGQAGVMKSDVAQLAIMLIGLLAVLAGALWHDATPLSNLPIELVNDSFDISKWTTFMLFIGGSYVVCPMLFSRMMSAKSNRSAKRAGWIAVVGLILVALLILGIGVEARAFLPADTPSDRVLTGLVETLPPAVKVVFSLAMLSAILSSADSCLITAATVVSNDLLDRKSVKMTRWMTIVVASIALLLSQAGHGILDLLLMANAVYVSAVVPPVFVVLMTKARFNERSVFVLICLVTVMALIGESTGEIYWSYGALAISIIGSLMLAYLSRSRLQPSLASQRE